MPCVNNKKEPSLDGDWTSKLHLKIRICLELQRKGRQMLTSVDKRKRFLPYCWLTLAILSKAALCWVATGVVKVLYIKLAVKTKRRRELRVNCSIVIKVLSVCLTNSCSEFSTLSETSAGIRHGKWYVLICLLSWRGDGRLVNNSYRKLIKCINWDQISPHHAAWPNIKGFIKTFRRLSWSPQD